MADPTLQDVLDAVSKLGAKIDKVDAKVEDTRTELVVKLSTTRAELRAEIQDVRSDIAAVRNELRAVRSDLATDRERADALAIDVAALKVKPPRPPSRAPRRR